MKLQFSLLLLASIAECAPQAGGLMSILGTELKPISKDQYGTYPKSVTPIVRKDGTAKRVIIKYGPLHLKGLNVRMTRQ
jgi:hypothetical protein